MKTIFIASSSESLKMAEKMKTIINNYMNSVGMKINVTLWNSVNEPSKYILDSLLLQLNNASCAIFLFTPDDICISRNNVYDIPRDNVIFELGLFIGLSSINNAFIIRPSDTKDHRTLKIPSDLSGVQYKIYGGNDDFQRACNELCIEIEKKLKSESNLDYLLKDLLHRSINDIKLSRTFSYLPFISKGFENIDKINLSNDMLSMILYKVSSIESRYRNVFRANKKTMFAESELCLRECNEFLDYIDMSKGNFEKNEEFHNFLQGYGYFKKADTLWYKYYGDESSILNADYVISNCDKALEYFFNTEFSAFDDRIIDDLSINQLSCAAYIFNLIGSFILKTEELESNKIYHSKMKDAFERCYKCIEAIGEDEIQNYAASFSQMERNIGCFYERDNNPVCAESFYNTAIKLNDRECKNHYVLAALKLKKAEKIFKLTDDEFNNNIISLAPTLLRYAHEAKKSISMYEHCTNMIPSDAIYLTIRCEIIELLSSGKMTKRMCKKFDDRLNDSQLAYKRKEIIKMNLTKIENSLYSKIQV